MEDSPQADGQVRLPANTIVLADDTNSQDSKSTAKQRWWSKAVPVWWGLLLGLASFFVGVCMTLWVFVPLRQSVATPILIRPVIVSTKSPEDSEQIVEQATPGVTTIPSVIAVAVESTATATPTPVGLQSTSVVQPQAQSEQISEALQLFQEGLGRRDAIVLQVALDMLDQEELTLDDEASDLRSRLLYAMDIMSGTIYLRPDNTTQWQLVDPTEKPFVQPTDMAISSNSLYVIDNGTLYRCELSALTESNGVLSMLPVIKPDAVIDGYPVKEIVAVAADQTGQSVFVLDKSGDIYQSEDGGDSWMLAKTVMSEEADPDPFILNITTWEDRLYGLDPARNQIWRHPSRDGSNGVLAGTLPWLLNPGEPDVTDGLDLAVDGYVYVLLRDGRVVRLSPNIDGYYDLAVAEGHSHVPQLEQVFTRPLRIVLDESNNAIIIADPDRRRVVALDRTTGEFLGQLVGASFSDFTHLRAIDVGDGQLFMLAGSNLYAFSLVAWDSNLQDLVGELPIWQLAPETMKVDTLVQGLLPNDPHLLDSLISMSFTLPVAGTYLPNRASAYPGARRAYRYGVHEGLDMYNEDTGAEIHIGTPVFAVADGILTRVDNEYVSLTITDTKSLLDDANQKHMTPPETLDKLGGRQVWIDHGNGVMTRYLHLSKVPENMEIGQLIHVNEVIGFVGLSGTLDGQEGREQLAHLHFEIRVGPDWRYSLGQWLTIEDTRRAYERIFRLPARPKN